MSDARFSAGDTVAIEAIPDRWEHGQRLQGRPGARGRVDRVGPMPGVWPDGAPVGILATWTPDDGSAPYAGWVGIEQAVRS